MNKFAGKWQVAGATGFWTFFGTTILWLAVAGWMRGRPAPSDVPARELADLAAQQSMADAAWAMVGITAASTIVAAIGIWFVFHTLVTARDATRTAVDSVEVQRILGKAQARAYITLDEYEVVNFEQPPRIRVSFKNTGQTPARNVVFSSGIHWIPEDEATPDVLGDFAHQPDIGAGTKISELADTRSLVEERYMELRFGDTPAMLLARVTYRDVFGDPHQTTSRIVLMNDDNGEVEGHIATRGNEAD